MLPALLTLAGLPLAVMLLQRRQRMTLDRFRTNAGGNGLLATACGAIAGNIGIGTFIAILAFSSVSPTVGLAVVLAYAAGLLLCAALAPAIRRRAAESGAPGLVDLVAGAHGLAQWGWIWGPVAVMFVLRASVQLGALGLLLVSAPGAERDLVTAACGALIALYLLAGGYRAAVGTDIAQAIAIIAIMTVAAFGLPPAAAGPATAPEAMPGLFGGLWAALGSGIAPGDLGPYRPALLIGIALFLPWTAVLQIDNWQRIVLARSTGTAQLGFLLAAVLCGAVYLLIALAGARAGPGADAFGLFAAMMPSGMGWLATVLFIACIMSSVDTFIMALVTSLGPRRGLARLRASVLALMAAAIACAILLDEVLATVITAFNTLTVMLPVVLAALFRPGAPARCAVLSVWTGFAVTLAVGWVNTETAALAGFAAAALAYALAHALPRATATARPKGPPARHGPPPPNPADRT